MKISRKILGFATGIGVLSASSIAMAAPASMNMEQLLPQNIDAVYTLDTTVSNPFEEHLKEWIKQTMAAEDSESDMALVDVVLDNNRMVYGMDMPEEIESGEGVLKDPKMYMGVRVTDDGFNALYEKAKSEMTITEETYKTETLYVGDNNTVVLHIGGLFIMTSSKEDAMDIVDRYKGEKNDALANYSNYQDVISHGNDKAFFSMYINPVEMNGQINEVLKELSDALPNLAEFNEKMVGSLEGEGIWISQNSTGFTMNVAVEGNDDKLQELKMNFNKNNFTPSLWQKMSGKGLMMYSEANLADSWMEDAAMLYGDVFANEDFVAWKTDFKADSGIDFDKEILNLMKNQQMFTMHKTEQLFPAVTWMVDVSSNRDANHNTIDKMNAYINKQMMAVEKETGMDFFKSETVDVNGMKFYKDTFNFGTLLKAEGDSIMDLVTDDKVTLNLYMATTIDGTMVISTLPDLNGMLNHKLTDNTTFAADFGTLNQEVADIGYIDLGTFNDYAMMFMQDLDAPQEVMDGYNDFMSPFKDISWKSWADSDTVWATLNMNVDIEGLAKTFKLAADWFTIANQSYDYDYPVESPFPPFTSADFCDVESSDWFSSYVIELSQMNIVEGYNDGCFHPERNVTKAEFTKMALGAAEKAGLYDSTVQMAYEAYYRDEAGWYDSTLNTATNLGYIHGVETSNGRYFYPNAAISRGEAVQILYNMSKQMKGVNTVGQSLESLNSFSDVKSTDWYFTAVTGAKYYGLVDGVSPISFEPKRNLTRAEAAKIILGFFHLESGE